MTIKKIIINTSIFLFVLISLGLQTLCQAQLEVINIENVYDGDTLKVNLLCNQTVFCDKLGIRVKGIDTPELKGKSITNLESQAGLRVRDFVRELTQGATRIRLENESRDKYFRIVAHVFIDDQCLGDLLYNKGYAKRYTGGKKEKWTDDELRYILEH